MTSSDAISQMFDSESQKLQNLINAISSKTDMNIHEIVETYYQVMNVSSMATMLKQQTDSEPNPLLSKIQETEKMISEKFNSTKFFAISLIMRNSFLILFNKFFGTHCLT